MKNNQLISLLLFTALVLIWGSAFLTIKIGLELYTPSQVAAFRIFGGCVTLLPFLRLKGLRRSELLIILGTGFLGSLVPAYLFSLAENDPQMGSGIAGVLSALTPLFTLLAGIMLFRQKASKIKIIGVLVGFAGTVLLVFSQDVSHAFSLSSAIYIILATACYALNLSIIKFVLRDIPSMVIASGSLLVVGIVAGVYLLSTDFIATTQSATDLTPFYNLCGLGVLATGISLLLFNIMVKNTTALFASSVTYVIPIVAVSLGMIIANEHITTMHIVSMFVILIGVYLINRKAS